MKLRPANHKCWVRGVLFSNHVSIYLPNHEKLEACIWRYGTFNSHTQASICGSPNGVTVEGTNVISKLAIVVTTVCISLPRCNPKHASAFILSNYPASSGEKISSRCFLFSAPHEISLSENALSIYALAFETTKLAAWVPYFCT
jgi:hypothetical protein